MDLKALEMAVRAATMGNARRPALAALASGGFTLPPEVLAATRTLSGRAQAKSKQGTRATKGAEEWW